MNSFHIGRRSIQGDLLSVSDTIAGQLGGTQSSIYDAVNRTGRIAQSGSGVAEKRIDLTYDAACQMTSLSRHADLAGGQLVATSNATYDAVRLPDSIGPCPWNHNPG